MSLLFLWQIAGKGLPIGVTDRLDIRRVSILASVGLVRAEFEPPLSARNFNQPTLSATVYEITQVGYKELNDFAEDMNLPPRQLFAGTAVAPPAAIAKLSAVGFSSSLELDQGDFDTERIAGLANGNLSIPTVGGQTPRVLQYSDLELDISNHRCLRGGASIKLSHKQFLLLSVLLSRPGKVFSHKSLIEKVWGQEADLSASVLEMAVARLRKKIDENSSNKLLHSVRGSGYMLDELPLQPWSRIHISK
ncbi:winged helix-turn-helix domain-containing protein [Variovorax sp. RB3P1]|uniref:winged helix-turn-helix domain-containing protein n=1 Tax=Variovorax sp. RB3P1 TaxID=3443732 RepID=UPI003F473BB5